MMGGLAERSGSAVRCDAVAPREPRVVADTGGDYDGLLDAQLSYLEWCRVMRERLGAARNDDNHFSPGGA